MIDSSSTIYVAGHSGMVGSAMVRALAARGYQRIVTRTSRELDLTRQQVVEDFLAATRPDADVDLGGDRPALPGLDPHLLASLRRSA